MTKTTVALAATALGIAAGTVAVTALSSRPPSPGRAAPLPAEDQATALGRAGALIPLSLLQERHAPPTI